MLKIVTALYLGLACALAATSASAQNTVTINGHRVVLLPENKPTPGVKNISKPVAPDGSQGMAILSAFVDSSSALNNSAGATATAHEGTGIYEVEFNRDVSQCFYSATGFSSVGGILAQPKNDNHSVVFIETFNNVGSSADETFYLTVFCNK